MHAGRKFATLLILLFGFSASDASATPETDFWTWFEKNQTELFDFEHDREKTFDRLAVEMHKVDPNLTFEFGPKQDGQREFVISADGIRKAFPKVESLYASAPPLPKWKFIKFRPRREPFDLNYNGVSVKASSVLALVEHSGQLAGITLYIPGYTSTARKTYLGIAFLFLDQALGEYDVETRVGFVEVKAPSAASPGARPLSELPKSVDEFYGRR
jgi:hypothetical protein